MTSITMLIEDADNFADAAKEADAAAREARRDAIVAWLERTGTPGSSLAAEVGVSRQYLHVALSGDCPVSDRVWISFCEMVARQERKR